MATVELPRGFVALRDIEPGKDTPLALPLADTYYCQVGEHNTSDPGATVFGSGDAPTITVCRECAATLCGIAWSVRMKGLVAQWRQQKIIHAETVERKRAAKAAEKKVRSTVDASEC
jgi:hypothetical protein